METIFTVYNPSTPDILALAISFTLESTGKWRVILECLNIGVIYIEFKFVDLSDYAIIHEFDPYKRSSSNIGI